MRLIANRKADYVGSDTVALLHQAIGAFARFVENRNLRIVIISHSSYVHAPPLPIWFYVYDFKTPCIFFSQHSRRIASFAITDICTG